MSGFFLLLFAILSLLFIYLTEEKLFSHFEKVSYLFLFSFLFITFLLFFLSFIFPLLTLFLIVGVLNLTQKYGLAILQFKDLVFTQNVYFFFTKHFFLVINTFSLFCRQFLIPFDAFFLDFLLLEAEYLQMIGFGSIFKTAEGSLSGKEIIERQRALNKDVMDAVTKQVNVKIKPVYVAEIKKHLDTLSKEERVKALSYMEFKTVHLFDKENEQKNERLFVQKLKFKSATEAALQKTKFTQTCEEDLQKLALLFEECRKHNYQNEMAISPCIKTYAKEGDVELASLLVKVIDSSVFQNNKVLPGKRFLTIYSEDNISTLNLVSPYVKGSTYIQYKDGVMLSKGQDTRVFLLSEGTLFRATNNADFVGTFAGIEGTFEIKNCKVDILGESSQSKFLAAYDKQENFEAFVSKNLISGKNAVVLKREAIPILDVTQILNLGKHHYSGSDEETILQIANFTAQGRIILLISSSGDGKDLTLVCRGNEIPYFYKKT